MQNTHYVQFHINHFYRVTKSLKLNLKNFSQKQHVSLPIVDVNTYIMPRRNFFKKNLLMRQAPQLNMFLLVGYIFKK